LTHFFGDGQKLAELLHTTAAEFKSSPVEGNRGAAAISTRSSHLAASELPSSSKRSHLAAIP